MPSLRAESSASAFLDLVEGHRATAVIYVAARLGIPIEGISKML